MVQQPFFCQVKFEGPFFLLHPSFGERCIFKGPPCKLRVRSAPALWESGSETVDGQNPA